MRIEETDNGNHRTVIFDSWDDFLAEASQDGSGGLSRRPKISDYHECQTWDDCLKLANGGWEEQIGKVASMLEEVRDDIKLTLQKTIEPVWDVHGTVCSINRLIQGDPKFMRRPRRVEASKQGRVITLLVGCSASGGTHKDKLIERGLAICGLVEAIRYMRHGVEIWCEQTVSTGRYKLTVLVKVKASNEPMNMGTVIFAVAHPDMLRRMVFSVEERQPREWRSRIGLGDMGSGYGMPEKLHCKDRVNAAIELEPIRYEHGTEDPKQWIRDNLAKWGLGQE